MKPPYLKASHKICLLAVGALLLFSQGCGQKTPAPAEIAAIATATAPLPTETMVPPTATNTPQPATATITRPVPTATLNPPTATMPLPTATPADRALPSQFLARLSLGRIEKIALSPERDRLVVAAASQICSFDTARFEPAWCKPAELPTQFEAGGPPEKDAQPVVHSPVFRPDGKQIVYGLWDGNIVFLDSATGQRMNVMDAYYLNGFRDLAWLQDGRQLVVQTDEHGIDIWDTSTGEQKGHLDLAPDQIAGEALSPDRRTLAVGLVDVGKIALWDMATLKQTGVVDLSPEGSAYDIAWSPDGNYLYTDITIYTSGCGGQCTESDCWIKAWDLAKGKLAFEIELGEDTAATYAVSPNGKWLAVGSGYWSVKVLDSLTGKEVVRQPKTSARDGLEWLDDDRLIYPSDLGEVDALPLSQLDMRSGEQTYLALPGFEEIDNYAWLPDSERLVTTSGGGTVSIWQAKTGERLEQFRFLIANTPLSTFYPSSISYLNGQLAASAGGSIVLVDVQTRQVLKTLEYPGGTPDTHIGIPSWSRDGKKVASVVYDHGKITVATWDAQTGKPLLRIPVENPIHIPSLALSPDGSHLALSWSAPGNPRLLVWDVEADKEAFSTDLPCSILQLNWLNQDQIVFSSPSGIETWDIATGKQLRTVAWGPLLAISPDGSLAVTSNGLNGFIVRDFRSGKQLAALKAETVYTLNATFSPDGRLLASASDYGSIITWDMSEFYAP